LKRPFLLLLIAISAAFSSLAQSQKKVWTLEECIRYAIDSNIAVQQADLNRKMLNNTYVQSKINLLPTLSVNPSYGFNFGYSVNPVNYTFIKQNSQTFLPTGQANLNVFMGLTQLNTIKKDKYDFQAANSDYLNTINNTVLNVTNLFLQIVLNKELVKAAQKQVNISQSQLDVAKSKIRAGTMAESAIYDFEAQLARDQATVISQQNSNDLSILALQIALQLPDMTSIDVIVPEINIGEVMSFDHLSAHDIYQYALLNQPSIKAAQSRVLSALYSIKIAKGNLSPTFSISYNTRDDYFNKASTTNITGFTTTPPYIISTETPTSAKDQFNQNFANNISINMNLPLFTGWQKMTAIANAKLQYKIQQLNIQAADNTLQQNVYQAYANAKGYAQSYSANLKALESQQKAFEVAQKRYNAGLAAAYELEQTRDALARSESNAIQAKYNYIFSVKVLDFYQGKPITLN
jgi:outer membrane protein